MTCVAAIADGDGITMAGDSAAVADFTLRLYAEPKLFRIGAYLIGFAASFRAGRMLQHGFQPPAPPRRDDQVDAFMATRFTAAMQSCMGDAEGGEFLVGLRGHLYQFDTDMHCGRPLDGFAAIGCAADIALGSLFSTQGQEPAARLGTALHAAERFSAGVRGPFHYARLPGTGRAGGAA